MKILVKPIGTTVTVAGSKIMLQETGMLWVGDEIWMSQKTYDLYVKPYKQ